MNSFFKIFFRSLKRQRRNYLINISGLVLGILSCIFIGTYIKDELEFDSHFKDANKIFRILDIIKYDNSVENSTSCPFPLGPTVAFEYASEVDKVTRLYNNWGDTYVVGTDKQETFKEKKFVFVDSTFLDVFSYTFIKGDPETALDAPYSVVLTQSAANKYFSGQDPIGKSLKINNAYNVEVTGVMEDMPQNSHFHFDVLCSFSTYEAQKGKREEAWGGNPCWTYVKFKDASAAADFDSKLATLKEKYIPEQTRKFIIQPLQDIHLKSHLDFEIEANGEVSYIYILSGITLMIMILVIVNYINQSTVLAMKRAKEIGVKKALGAFSNQLFYQFLSETMVLSFIALLISVLLIYPLIPAINDVVSKTFFYRDFFTMDHVVFYGIIVLFVGLASGIYPAIYLASLNPVAAIKGKIAGGRGISRKFLISIQFIIAIIMIAGTMIVFSQVHFLSTLETGFQKQNVVVIDVFNTKVAKKQLEPFIAELKEFSDIENATAMQYLFGHNYNTWSFAPEGAEPALYSFNPVHYDFFETFNIPVLQGRTFSRQHSTDADDAVVINESMVRSLGWTSENAIDKRFGIGEAGGKVIGVVGDFNFQSLHAGIQPLALVLGLDPHKWIAVRFKAGKDQEVVKHIKRIWSTFEPDAPLELMMLNDKLNTLYKSESQLGKISFTFTVIAILISCVGILGLIIFLTRQRLKEIAVRRVLGSSLSQIVLIFSMEFVWLVVIASIVAWPLIYWGASQWLQAFAFKITLSPLIFIAASGLVLLITEGIVIYQSLKVAQTKPTEILRNA